MKLTDRLKVEHGVFLKQLAFLESLATHEAPPQVLAAVAETIGLAEEQHSELEGRLLYPLLEKALGADYAPLRQVGQDHADLAMLIARVRAGAADDALILQLVKLMREHLEREIHGLFALAEQWIPTDRLESLANWDEEHLYESLGRRSEWAERWLKRPPS
jgi:hemerythrin-like domain-containing protein